MLHSGCVKLHQKFRDFVGLPMGLLREESQKNRMNTGLFGSRSGEYGFNGCPPVGAQIVRPRVFAVFRGKIFGKVRHAG